MRESIPAIITALLRILDLISYVKLPDDNISQTFVVVIDR